MVKRILQFLILSTIAAIALGFFGHIHPALDTGANFRTHLSLILVILALVWGYFFSWKQALFLAALAIFGFFSSAGSNIIGKMDAAKIRDTDASTYSLLHLNLYYANKTPKKVFDLIDRISPDILTLNELSTNWQSRLKSLDQEYPYSFHCPEWTRIGGSVIYSRLPMSAKEGKCESFAALALKDVKIGKSFVTIGSVHLRWPWPASGPRQVDEIRPLLEGLGEDALIAGDFNSAPWTYLLRRFANAGKLEIVDYLGASWMYRRFPTSLAAAFGLPLDNAMAKGNVSVINAYTLETVGSDHLPLLIRFHIQN